MKTDFNPKQILIPIDLSELSDLALKYAHVGAQLFNSELTVLNAVHFEYPRYLSKDLADQVLKEMNRAKSDARKYLSEHVHGVLGDVAKKDTIHYLAMDIDPAQAILSAADEKRADLIVMGTHGYSGFKHWMMGSVAEKVLHLSRVPVFTVRQKIDDFIDTNAPNTRPEIRHILCPCNLTPSAAGALRTAASLAQRMNARLTVLYSTASNNASDEEKPLRTWNEETLPGAPHIDTVIRQGDAADQTITVADQLGIDLIVIGICHRPFSQGTVVGRTTERVTRHASMPVLAVP
jgi:nucleotide-binding universal stress UspA family protein